MTWNTTGSSPSTSAGPRFSTARRAPATSSPFRSGRAPRRTLSRWVLPSRAPPAPYRRGDFLRRRRCSTTPFARSPKRVISPSQATSCRAFTSSRRSPADCSRSSTAVGYDPRSLPAFAPLSEAEQKGLLDPLSAMFLPVSGTNGLDRANCERKLRIYDGRRRFDLVMSYHGIGEDRRSPARR